MGALCADAPTADHPDVSRPRGRLPQQHPHPTVVRLLPRDPAAGLQGRHHQAHASAPHAHRPPARQQRHYAHAPPASGATRRTPWRSQDKGPCCGAAHASAVRPEGSHRAGQAERPHQAVAHGVPIAEPGGGPAGVQRHGALDRFAYPLVPRATHEGTLPTLLPHFHPIDYGYWCVYSHQDDGTRWRTPAQRKLR